MSGLLPVSGVVAAFAGTVVLRIRSLRRTWRAQRSLSAPRWSVDGGISTSAAAPDAPRASAGSADGGAFPSRAALRRNVA